MFPFPMMKMMITRPSAVVAVVIPVAAIPMAAVAVTR